MVKQWNETSVFHKIMYIKLLGTNIQGIFNNVRTQLYVYQY